MIDFMSEGLLDLIHSQEKKALRLLQEVLAAWPEDVLENAEYSDADMSMYFTKWVKRARIELNTTEDFGKKKEISNEI